MTAHYVEVGFVSADPSLVRFIADVFELEELAVIDSPIGTVTKLRGPGDAVLKVFVPTERPQRTARRDPFYGVTGLRFVTIRVDDLDGVIERASARGGKVASAPRAVGPGIRLAFLEDPDGNTYEVSESSA